MYPLLAPWKGWLTDYADDSGEMMEAGLIGLLNRATNIAAGHKVVEPTLSAMSKYPFIYTVEPEQLDLTAQQARDIREWLRRGGFWMMDDFHGCEERAHVMAQMELVLGHHVELEPDHNDFTTLTPDHPIFHTLYDIDAIVQVPVIYLGQYWMYDHTSPTWEAQPPCNAPTIFMWDGGPHDGAILMAWNEDLGDGLEHIENPTYPAQFSLFSYKFFSNAILYALSH